MDKVVIYTSTGCSYCAQLKRWLIERSVAFEERNVTENPAYFDELTARGIFSTPAALIGDTPVVGFRPNKMKELLGLQ